MPTARSIRLGRSRMAKMKLTVMFQLAAATETLASQLSDIEYVAASRLYNQHACLWTKQSV